MGNRQIARMYAETALCVVGLVFPNFLLTDNEIMRLTRQRSCGGERENGGFKILHLSVENEFVHNHITHSWVHFFFKNKQQRLSRLH